MPAVCFVLLTKSPATPPPRPTPMKKVVYDINGREAVEAEPLLKALKPSQEQYIYSSSAGGGVLGGWGFGGR